MSDSTKVSTQVDTRATVIEDLSISQDDTDDDYNPTESGIPPQKEHTKSHLDAIVSDDGGNTPSFLKSGSPAVSALDQSRDALSNKITVDPTATTSKNVKKPTKRKRLPKDLIGQLEDKLSIDKYDLDTWLHLITVVREKDKQEEIQSVYDQFLEIFTTNSDQWIGYIEYELSQNEFQKVEQLFAKCLLVVYDVKLWQHYIGYVRRVNNITTGGEKARGIITRAFEFAIDRIGIDEESGLIWGDYIEFIRSWKPISGWEDQQKMDLLRKTYRSAVCIPLNNLELLWQGYNLFENNINKSTARKFISEKSAAYMAARSGFKELTNLFKQFNRHKSPRLPSWTSSEIQSQKAWKKWIKWELTNPLELNDPKEVQKRVIYAYQQALSSNRFVPEMWYDATQYTFSIENKELGMKFITDGIAANPTSYALTFYVAEVYEQQGNTEAVRTAYSSLITQLKKKLAALELADEAEKTETEYRKELSVNITLVYVFYMRAIKRSEGLDAARKIFGEARKNEFITYHIYVQSALMEYHTDNKSHVSFKVFDFGMRRFSENTEYIQEYMKFLILIGDDTNARALFEKTVSKLSPQDAKPLYEQFIDYEANYGDLGAVLKLQERYMKLFTEDSLLGPKAILSKDTVEPYFTNIENIELSLFTIRYTKFNVNLIYNYDLGYKYIGHGELKTNGNVIEDSENPEQPPSKRFKENNTDLQFSQDFNETQLSEPFVNDEIYDLLRLLPSAESMPGSIFDPAKLVKLLSELEIPNGAF